MSKIDSKIKPAAPAIENNIDPIAQDLSNNPLLGTNCPACRSHRSARNERSRNTTVITLPVMKSGLRPCAPTSDIYLSSQLGKLFGGFRQRVHVRDALTWLHARIVGRTLGTPYSQHYPEHDLIQVSILYCLIHVSHPMHQPIHMHAEITGNIQKEIIHILFSFWHYAVSAPATS